MAREIGLRYGCNPHQTPARAYRHNGLLPFEVLNGSVGYINLLDALNSWQLVKELKAAIGLPASASFKHVSPSGAAIGLPLSDTLRQAYQVADLELSPLAVAYARARGADRLCSFGDWVAVSDPVDLPLAHLLQREVSDGIVASDYEPAALAILAKKKQGKYVILQIDPGYEPPDTERREVFGVILEQKRNEALLGVEALQNVITAHREWPAPAQRDAIVALITLKYTQSNSVCLAINGQVIGVGVGQQSRIHCTRFAAAKADTWYLRQHPRVLDLPFRRDIRRPDRDNGIDQYLRDDLMPAEERVWAELFTEVPARLTAQQKRDWLRGMRDVVLASDGYIPFRDSVDRAYQSGVKFVAQPGGSHRDEQVIAACNGYGMAMAFTDLRLFHH